MIFSKLTSQNSERDSTYSHNLPNYSSTHENNMAWPETYDNAGPYFFHVNIL